MVCQQAAGRRVAEGLRLHAFISLTGNRHLRHCEELKVPSALFPWIPDARLLDPRCTLAEAHGIEEDEMGRGKS